MDDRTFSEAVKCHHNEIARYIRENYADNIANFNDEIYSSSNYEFFECEIIFRSLNYKNIYLDANMHVKINNFDISETEEFSNKDFIINDVHAFNAPEIINEKVDVYAFGVIMHYILTKGELPVFTTDSIIISKNINQLSHEIILNCLSLVPEKRPSFNEILSMFDKNNYLLIDGIQDKVSELKKHLGLP